MAKLWICGLVLLLTLAGGIAPARSADALPAHSTAAETQSDSQQYPLEVDFKPPFSRNALRFIQLTGLKLFQSPRTQVFYVYVSNRELKQALGLETSVSVVRGAGNRTDSNAVFIEIKDTRTLKKEIRALVKHLRLEDDPKFSLLDDAREYHFPN